MECAALTRSLGDVLFLAMNLGNLAVVEHARGDAEKAASLFEESLTLARDLGDGFLASQVLSVKGCAECRDGNLEFAEASLVESLTIAGDLKDPNSAAQALEGFAELAVATHAPKPAAMILGAAARLRDEIGLLVFVHDEREHKRLATAARTAMGDNAFDLAWREGHAMTLEEVVHYAMECRAERGT